MSTSRDFVNFLEDGAEYTAPTTLDGKFNAALWTIKGEQKGSFTKPQLEHMTKIYERFTGTQTNKKKVFDGLILKAYMGAGKTLMSIAIMFVLRQEIGKSGVAGGGNFSRPIVVICPDALRPQWQTELGKLFQGPAHVRTYTELMEEIKHPPEAGQVVLFPKSGLYIFDECHNIRTLANRLTDAESVKLCTFLQQHAIKRLGLTGTLIYYSKDDLLYEVNALTGLVGSKWALPFTWTHLNNIYTDVEGDTGGFWYALKSILGGWIFNLENLRLFPLPNFLAIADIGDFYFNRYSPYYNSKFELVDRALRQVPGFDTGVLKKDLKGVSIKGPMSIVSIMLMTTMLNPFSYMIPTIFALIAVQNQNTFNDLDKEAMQKHICPMIVDMANEDVDVRRDVVTRLAAEADWVKDQWGLYVKRPLSYVANKVRGALSDDSGEVKDEPDYNTANAYQETVNKWVKADKFIKEIKDGKATYVHIDEKEIKEKDEAESQQPEAVFITTCHRFEEVAYTMPQLMLFMRFTTNRLTPTEARLLGISEEKRTMRDQLTLGDLETVGLKIGSIAVTPANALKIDQENKARKEQFIEQLGADGDWLKMANTYTPPEGLGLDVSAGEGAADDSVTRSDAYPKFEHIRQRLQKQEPGTKVVLFSQFSDVLSNFEQYCGGNDSHLKFHEVEKNAVENIKPADYFNLAAKKKEDKTKVHILLLDKDRADGFDGLQDVKLMIIMEPCTTDSMKRQLIARVVRQRAHSQSRTVDVYEYVSTPGFLNIKKVYASMSDWWTHDKRVAPWVFKPLLSQARTPDQIVVANQMVSGEMEDLCQGNRDEFEKGFINKFRKADLRTAFKTWSFGKDNEEELKDIERRLNGREDKQKRWRQWQRFRNENLNPGKQVK